jgi:hypothetical protein
LSANPYVTITDCGPFVVMTRPRAGYRKKHVTDAFILPKWRVDAYLGVPRSPPRDPKVPELSEVRLSRGGFATNVTEAPNGELIEEHVPVVDVEGRALRLPDDYDWGERGYSWRLLFAVQVPDLPDEDFGPRLVEMARLLVANEMPALAKKFADDLEAERVRRESDEAIGRMETLAKTDQDLGTTNRAALYAVGGRNGGR